MIGLTLYLQFYMQQFEPNVASFYIINTLRCDFNSFKTFTVCM